MSTNVQKDYYSSHIHTSWHPGILRTI